MKLLVTLAYAFLVALVAKAYTPGELICFKGRTCLVLALDSTRQKALIMAPPAMYIEGKTDKDRQKKIEKNKHFKDFFAAGGLEIIPSIPITSEYKQRKKELEQIIKESTKKWNIGKALTGAYQGNSGKNNILATQDAIEKAVQKYFKSHNLKFADYYPEYYWAENHGEGWFLGSTEEFLLYHNVVNGLKKLQEKNELQSASGHKFFYPLNLRNPFRYRYLYVNYSKYYNKSLKCYMYNYGDTFLSSGEVAYQGSWGGKENYVKLYSKGEKEYGICAIACCWIPNNTSVSTND